MNRRECPSAAETAYLDLLRKALEQGRRRQDRTGVGTRSLFGEQLRLDLREGFPLLTTKKVHFRSVAEELFWFLRGETDVAPLQARGVSIWDEWATPEAAAKLGLPVGDLGPVYGHQWRNFGATRLPGGHHASDGVDQIAGLLTSLREHPDSRRHMLAAWNPRDLGAVTLPPCHVLCQFDVFEGELSAHLYQRSADLFLGVPFNIASYALLVHVLAREVGLTPGYLVHSFGDAHLYANHVEQARLQLTREPRALPALTFRECQSAQLSAFSVFHMRFEDLVLSGYNPHPAISAPVAV